MAVVQGIREKVHLPIYDSLSVQSGKQLRDAETTSILKFFVNVQGKTKLETNLQSASLLPHYNTFEARAMRVVISDLPPQFPIKSAGLQLRRTTLSVVSKENPEVPIRVETAAGANQGKVLLDGSGNPATTGGEVVIADIEFGLDRVMALLSEARRSDDQVAFIVSEESGVSLRAGALTTQINAQDVFRFGNVELTIEDLEALIEELDEKLQPPKEQLRPNNGAGTII